MEYHNPRLAMIMRFLIALLFLVCLPLYAANPSYNNFNSNQFLRVGNNLYVRQVWTNDGRFVFLSGYTNYQDGVHQDPPYVIKTNGSFAVGRNVRQDTSLPSPKVPYVSMMTDSNEATTVGGTWQVIDSEEYGKLAGAFLSVTTDSYARFGLDLKHSDGSRSAITLQTGPTYDKFIDAATNNASVASLGYNGSWNAVSYRGLGDSSPADVGGITRNITVVTNGANTATMHFTNGVLMSITAP